jgi:spore germination cell wall hydrolase CwlJ-like protein
MMKTSKTVIDSIAVAALAMVLAITAVTGNGVSAVSNTADAETQVDKNGIAGVAITINGYDEEAAAYLGSVVSVEKVEAEVLTAAEEAEVSIEEELSEEEIEWQDKLMADVEDFLYVRAKADADSEIVGKLYKGDRAVIKKQGNSWTKIVSGNVKGYVNNEYCVTGADALAYAKENCDTVAKVAIDGLRIRKKQSTNAGIVKTATAGEKLAVDTEAKTKEGWVAVKVDSKTCYVSADYVTVSLKTGKAVTLEEEAAAQKAAEEVAAKKAAAQQSSGGQTTSTGSTQNSAISASVDDETLLAAIIQCEAGGQSMQCMTAVGAVVVNRVRSGSFPSSISGVIYQRGQFGPASSGALARRLANGVSSSARQAAQAALSGSDPTSGAKYFKLASSGHAGVVIGPIVFY